MSYVLSKGVNSLRPIDTILSEFLLDIPYEMIDPTYTMAGALDPFRDETIIYVERLLQAGVPVEFRIVPGVFHGFENILRDSPISRQARNEYIQALSNALK